MKILVVGGGAVGGVICRLLCERKEVDKIICVDMRQRHSLGSKVQFKLLDISKGNNLQKLLNETKPDVVINSVLPLLNTKIMKACLQAKANYLDMASYWDIDKNPKAKIPYKFEELGFDAKFKKAGLIGLFGAGVAPGITNLLAKEASTHLDSVDSIKMRLIEDSAFNDEIVFSWNKEWLLDEINWKPLIYENGKYKIVPNFSGEEEFEFPAPYGKKKVVLLAQDEVGTIPLYIKVKNVDLKAYDNQGDVMGTLFKLGLTSDKKVDLGECKMSPLDFLVKVLPNVPESFAEKKFDNARFLLVVKAEGKKGGKKKTITYSVVFPNQKEINHIKGGGNFISYPTAFSAVLFALAIPKISRKGAFPPEAINDDNVRKGIISELKKHTTFKESIR